MKYQDTSTGQLVGELKSGLGPCNIMTKNQQNAIIHLGHSNGNVTLWSPNMQTPIVKMWCHRGPVSGIAIDNSGMYMVTTGLDCKMKIWDVRSYKPVEEYFTPRPVSCLDISQTGLIGVGYGGHVTVWKDAFKSAKVQSPYMSHLHAGSIVSDIGFCPYEDVLGYGHTGGMSSIVIPGSANAHFNVLEVNPDESKKQRQDGEVFKLLEKVSCFNFKINCN